MPKAFISYRREDSQDVSGRLYDHLVARWGPERVFKDVDSIPLGMDFREHLTEAVGRCEVMLVVIGPRWVEVTREGRRRLEDPLDFVRIEVEAALQRGVPVVPVLVGGAAVPAPEELPESLRPLAYRQASLLRPDPDFRGDVARIIHGVERLPVRAAPAVRPAAPAPAPPPLPTRAPTRPSGPPLSERALIAAGRGAAAAWRAFGAFGKTIRAWTGGAGRDVAAAGRSGWAEVRRARAARAAARRAKPPPLPPAREVSAGLFWGVTGPLLLAAIVLGLLLDTPWNPSAYDATRGFGSMAVFLTPGLALCTPLLLGSPTRLKGALWTLAGAFLAGGAAAVMILLCIGVSWGDWTDLVLWPMIGGGAAVIAVPLRVTVLWGMPKDHASCIGKPLAPIAGSRVTRA